MYICDYYTLFSVVYPGTDTKIQCIMLALFSPIIINCVCNTNIIGQKAKIYRKNQNDLHNVYIPVV